MNVGAIDRVLDKQRIVAEMGDRLAKTPTKVYAREQIILHERQQMEIVVQALRIGPIGIATTPNETYAITGLKIKAASPLPHTLVIELANGGDGYTRRLRCAPGGGYNTWAARSVGFRFVRPACFRGCLPISNPSACCAWIYSKVM